MCFPTRSGKVMDFESPSADSIAIQDIGHALSHICRFNGHGNTFYSVAQHSVLVASLFKDPTEKLYALLHDAHETYTGDVNSPFKRYLEAHCPGLIKEVEKKIDMAIHEHFGLQYPLPKGLKERIKDADNMVFASEVRDLASEAHATGIKNMDGLSSHPGEQIIIAMNPEDSKEFFNAAFMYITREIARTKPIAIETSIAQSLALRRPIVGHEFAAALT